MVGEDERVLQPGSVEVGRSQVKSFADELRPKRTDSRRVGDVAVSPGEVRAGDSSAWDPAAPNGARSRRWIVSRLVRIFFDVLVVGVSGDGGASERQHLDEAGVSGISGVGGAEVGIGVVPLVGTRVAPVGPCPRLRRKADSPDGLSRRDCAARSAHAPTNARAAAMTCGPTSSRSPSRISRAGERSPSCGFMPCSHRIEWQDVILKRGEDVVRGRPQEVRTTAVGQLLDADADLGKSARPCL